MTFRPRKPTTPEALEHWRRSCSGKLRHNSRERALVVLARMRCDGVGGEIQPYRCIWCVYWHLGHPTGSRAQAAVR